MARAVLNGTVIAESPRIEIVDGYTYFPRDAVKMQYLKPSTTTSVCSWKGSASYFTVSVNGVESRDAAWSYEYPKPSAARIAGMIGFWRDIVIESRSA